VNTATRRRPRSRRWGACIRDPWSRAAR
jgi:hypothetical protein